LVRWVDRDSNPEPTP